MSDDDKRPDNVVHIRDAMRNAQPVLVSDNDGGAMDDAPPVGNAGPPDDQARGRKRTPLPTDQFDFPVKPLGVNGEIYYYLDDLNQLRALKAKDHSRNNLVSLFGRKTDILQEIYPRLNKDGEVTGFQAEKYNDDLMRACAHKGVWDPLDRVRGSGAWRGENGELILHCGNKIYVFPIFDEEGHSIHDLWAHRDILQPDLIGRAVYPAAPPGPKPHEAKQDAEGGVGDEILRILNTWNWRRHELDAHLMFGWICAAWIGGALPWRPACWITGGAGTGKSSLHEVIKHLLNELPISISDPTAAAIWQKLGSASLPVAIDELEAEEDGRTANNVIKLARQAASGGVVIRGGADHKAHEFKIQSPFMFSSILVPPLQAQDRSRLAILELAELIGKEPPNTEPKRMKELGLRLLRRMVDGWARLPQALEQYRAALQKKGLSSRACDQYGTLLACADLALFDRLVDSEYADEWAEQIEGVGLVSWGDDERDEDEMLRHLLTTSMDPYRSGGRHIVAEWIIKAKGSPQEVPDKDAQRALGTYGLKVERSKELDNRWVLIIANKHQGLSKIFDETRWAHGVWRQAALRLKNSFQPRGAVYFAGATSRAVAIDMESVMPLGMEETREFAFGEGTPNDPSPDPEVML